MAEYIACNPHRIYLYKTKSDRWSSYCIEFARHLRRMEAVVLAFKNEVEAGIMEGRCTFEKTLRDAFFDAGFAQERDMCRMLTGELEYLRSRMLRDLAEADVPSYDCLLGWADNMKDTVRGLAFIFIPGIVMADAPPLEMPAMESILVPAWSEATTWAGTAAVH